MPKVIADITMSLDGYVTGPGADEQHGLGDAPELHLWVTEQDAVDTEILEGATAQSGAVIMGRRLFDVVDGPGGWNEDMGYGAIRRERRRSSSSPTLRRRSFGSNVSSGCASPSSTIWPRQSTRLGPPRRMVTS